MERLPLTFKRKLKICLKIFVILFLSFGVVTFTSNTIKPSPLGFLLVQQPTVGNAANLINTWSHKNMDKKQLRRLIEEVLTDSELYSEEAVELLMGTAAVESALGHYIEQVGSGIAKGIFQMEPATESDIWNNFLQYNKPLQETVREFINERHFEYGEELEWNLAYQIIMARLHYLRVPEKLPSVADIEGQAYYWKRYYNTHLGKGTRAKYEAAYNKFVKGT